MGPESSNGPKIEKTQSSEITNRKIEKYFPHIVNIIKKEAGTAIRLAYISYKNSHPDEPEGFSYRGLGAQDLLDEISRAEILYKKM